MERVAADLGARALAHPVAAGRSSPLAWLLLAALIASAAPVAAGGRVEAPELRRALRRSADLRVAGQRVDTARLHALYRRRDFAPIWNPRDGGAERAAALLRVLAQAADHGLDPARYHVLDVSPGGQPASALDRELRLTDALLRYARDVRLGRVRPGAIEHDWDIRPPAFDLVADTAAALESDRFEGWLAALPPGHPGYRRLAERLIQYRHRVAGHPAITVPPGPVLRPGARDGRIDLLRRRLAAEEPERPGLTAGPIYDAELESAVRRFQARHALEADALVGPLTRRALNVPLAVRLQQIELNLERWRWLPRDLGPRYAIVNAAAAMLSMVEASGDVLVSRVIVGDPDHPTPVLASEIRALVLNPAWTIPDSIVAAEIVPALQRDPRYLLDRDIEVLDRLDTDPHGLSVDWSAVPAREPPPRLRQRPGPTNPLGRIKFDLPNRFDVYLHETPSTALFARPVRTRSHGCVRIERALDLATLALAGHELADRPRLAHALATGGTRRVPLARPLPVYFLYWTAFVDDGTLQFREDVYGRDHRLAVALGGAVASPSPSSVVGCASQR
jgi:murein L,D-transpeptidase YcbB/YkuD